MSWEFYNLHLCHGSLFFVHCRISPCACVALHSAKDFRRTPYVFLKHLLCTDPFSRLPSPLNPSCLTKPQLQSLSQISKTAVVCLGSISLHCSPRRYFLPEVSPGRKPGSLQVQSNLFSFLKSRSPVLPVVYHVKFSHVFIAMYCRKTGLISPILSTILPTDLFTEVHFAHQYLCTF